LLLVMSRQTAHAAAAAAAAAAVASWIFPAAVGPAALYIVAAGGWAAFDREQHQHQHLHQVVYPAQPLYQKLLLALVFLLVAAAAGGPAAGVVAVGSLTALPHWYPVLRVYGLMKGHQGVTGSHDFALR
jgi:hypothetical protein